MPAQTLDEVLAQLDEVILHARQTSSRLGYFATLYRNVTLRVKEGIAAGLAKCKITFSTSGNTSELSA